MVIKRYFLVYINITHVDCVKWIIREAPEIARRPDSLGRLRPWSWGDFEVDAVQAANDGDDTASRINVLAACLINGGPNMMVWLM